MTRKEDLGRTRIFNNAFEERGVKNVVMWDVIPISDGENLKLVFESKNSPWRQGVWLRTDMGLVINKQNCPSATLWYDTSPSEVICKCHTKKGFLSIYNIWDSGRGLGTESQKWSSGMLIEEIPNGWRYRCNDIGFETDFDKIVFRVEKLQINVS